MSSRGTRRKPPPAPISVPNVPTTNPRKTSAAPRSIVASAGLAEIAAGSIAMGLGGYLAGKSDLEHYIRERAREELEIAQMPEVEAAEVTELLQSHGLTAEESAPVVAALRKRPEAWRD